MFRSKCNLIKTQQNGFRKNGIKKIQTSLFFHFWEPNAITSALSGSRLSKLGYFWFINIWESPLNSAWHHQCVCSRALSAAEQLYHIYNRSNEHCLFASLFESRLCFNSLHICQMLARLVILVNEYMCCWCNDPGTVLYTIHTIKHYLKNWVAGNLQSCCCHEFRNSLAVKYIYILCQN